MAVYQDSPQVCFWVDRFMYVVKTEPWCRFVSESPCNIVHKG